MGKEEEMKDVVYKVYTRKDCKWCPVLKKWLTMKDIPFIEVDAEKNEAEFLKEAANISQSISVPQLVLPSGKVLVGFNIPQLSKELL